MLNILPLEIPELAPLATTPADLPILNCPLREYLARMLDGLSGEIFWRPDFIPSRELTSRLAAAEDFAVIDTATGETLASRGDVATAECFAPEGFRVRFPWDVLAVNETLAAQLDADRIEGGAPPGVHIEGHVVLGPGSRLLPGVFIEGNVIIGGGCKIGPNCYLRGNSVIGDRVHIGQAVEIKNSVIGARSSIGHLSYVGDSVIAEGVNFGAGTIIGNLRHDGRNHRSLVSGELIDTGRRKFGAIVGAGVHTGINTAIYPGRKLWPGVTTRPGEIVGHDKRA